MVGFVGCGVQVESGGRCGVWGKAKLDGRRPLSFGR